MSWPPRTALPLGAYAGVDALDVWEHVLFQEFLETRWRPLDAEAERLDAERFEAEMARCDAEGDEPVQPVDEEAPWDEDR